MSDRPVPSVDDPTSEAVDSAAPATDSSIEPHQLVDWPPDVLPPSGTLGIQINAQSSDAPTESDPDTSKTPDSSPSDAQSASSRRRYKTPKNPLEFASLVSMVAVQVMNGEVDLDKARAFASLTRTAAQAMTTESAMARSQKTVPELTLTADVFEEEEDA